MPRHPRLFLAEYPLHIVHRGHDRGPLFAGESDYEYYIDNLREQKTLLDIRVYAYCLMTNHVHLVIQPDSEPATVSKLMKVVAARQTRRVNKAKNRSGTLREGRFKGSLIDTDTYLLACCRYVELNPLRAAMVCDPADYRWSSYRFRGSGRIPAWLDIDPVYAALGDSPAARASGYRRFVSKNIEENEIGLIRRALQRNQLTGSDAFVQAISRMVKRRISTQGQGRPAMPRTTRHK
jgi:putative transposase